jgi:DNA polymerase-4
MPMVMALKLCPELIIVDSHRANYGEYSSKVMSLLHDYTNLIEQVSIDEAFLDITHLDDDAVLVAQKIQDRINQELNLPCSIGVATNKLVAKVANDYGKSSKNKPQSPNTITVVKPGKEEEFLAPLPVRALLGIGPKTAEKMAGYGIHTIGDISLFPEDKLVELFGKHGRDLAKRSRGMDDRPITTSYETKSISNERTFTTDIQDQSRLEEVIELLSRKVGKRLRKNNKSARVIRIKLRWSNFTTITRQITIDQPVSSDDQISLTAKHLFRKAWTPKSPVRLLGVGVSGLDEIPIQLELWGTEKQNHKPSSDEVLDKAVRSIQNKFGGNSIRLGWREGFNPDK